MSKTPPPVRVGILGSDSVSASDRHGCGLWAAGYASCVTAAGAGPVTLGESSGGRSWDQVLAGLDGVILAGTENISPRLAAQGNRLSQWCRKHEYPILAIDGGLHVLNGTFGGF